MARCIGLDTLHSYIIMKLELSSSHVTVDCITNINKQISKFDVLVCDNYDELEILSWYILPTHLRLSGEEVYKTQLIHFEVAEQSVTYFYSIWEILDRTVVYTPVRSSAKVTWVKVIIIMNFDNSKRFVGAILALLRMSYWIGILHKTS